jgi:hypothetical protein
MMKKFHAKKIGFGSLSLILFILGIAFSLQIDNREAFGNMLLRKVGIPSWSNGTQGFNYAVLYTLLFLMIAWILGKKFNNHYGATWGKKLSFWGGIVLIPIIILFSI